MCASEIRTDLDNYDFGLENSFCDAEDLKIPCNNMKISDPFLHIFFNLNTETYQEAAESIMTNDNCTTEEDGDQYNENANDHRNRSDNLSTQRCRKVQSLFQIMYYVHH